MKEFFSNLDPSLRIYWYIAIAASLFFIVHTIISFTGGHSDTGEIDVDTDSDTSSVDNSFHILDLLSLRNLTAFLLGFGWSGVAFYNRFPNHTILLIVAIIVGLIFVALFFVVLKSLLRLAEDNSFNINDTMDKTADVYLSIPANKAGKGKVLISVKGSVHELSAMTDDDEDIKTGRTVRVVNIYDNSVLIVRPIMKENKAV